MSALAGVAVMILVLPVNIFISSKEKEFNKVQMVNKDERMKLMDETLNGIKFIKLYAW
jgi:hypothetical protein